MGGKKPLRRPLWPPTRATASNYYPLGLDGAGGAAKPLLRAPKKPAPLHGRLPAFSGAVDAFERARKCFLEWRYFFSIILSEFLKNRVALQANPPFAGDIKENTIISHYELGKNSAGKWQNKVGRDVLFIERNLNFLKPSGRMAIVLPQGRFNNSSDKYIREFIAERCRILAVVGLHGNVFKPHTGTKTSVLFVQKWDDELCPKKEDYPIFFATMQKPSKDNSGEKIYVKDPITGENVLDRHGHLIVDHDLYSHDGLTPDGIAEAFIEFAKKEGLSFFQ